MAGIVDRWMGSLAQLADLPEDVMRDLPRIYMVGRSEMIVENHKEILEYTPERIRLRVKGGVMEITGTNIKIRSLHKQEVVMAGTFAGVDFAK